MNHHSISVFFPSYNEEGNIRKTVEIADAVLKKITPTYEIIVVNDGSRDATGAVADKLVSENSKVRVVHHPKNLGYGAALWSGIHAAQYDWIFFTDADLQFDLNEINKLLQYIPEYKVVLGYRSPRRDSFMRLLNAKGWNWLVRTLFSLKVRDIDCAFKLFHKDVITSLPLKTRGATMSAEMLIRIMRKGIPWKEVPVSHFPRTLGSPTGAKISVIVRAFKELFVLYWNGL